MLIRIRKEKTLNQVLSQSEVDALLSAVSDNRIDVDDGSNQGDANGVVQYDRQKIVLFAGVCPHSILFMTDLYDFLELPYRVLYEK